MILELAARCEAATGPDRELDAEIAVAALGFFVDDMGKYAYTDAEGVTHKSGQGSLMLVREFTASIDSAMTLVPEGWGRCIEQERMSRPCEASLSPPDCEPWGHGAVNAEGATLALALCAAALRARATKETTREDA